MSSPRKSLKERIIGATPEPPVVIAPADPAPNKAREGWEAIDQLVKERNDSNKRADLQDRRVLYLININNNLRERENYERARADHAMQLVAQLGVLATQACDVTNQIYQLLAQNAALVQRISPPPKVTNNPGAPAVIEETGPQYDDQGVPFNSAPPSPTPEELKQVIERLGTNGGVQ